MRTKRAFLLSIGFTWNLNPIVLYCHLMDRKGRTSTMNSYDCFTLIGSPIWFTLYKEARLPDIVSWKKTLSILIESIAIQSDEYRLEMHRGLPSRPSDPSMESYTAMNKSLNYPIQTLFTVKTQRFRMRCNSDSELRKCETIGVDEKTRSPIYLSTNLDA